MSELPAGESHAGSEVLGDQPGKESQEQTAPCVQGDRWVAGERSCGCWDLCWAMTVAGGRSFPGVVLAAVLGAEAPCSACHRHQPTSRHAALGMVGSVAPPVRGRAVTPVSYVCVCEWGRAFPFLSLGCHWSLCTPESWQTQEQDWLLQGDHDGTLVHCSCPSQANPPSGSCLPCPHPRQPCGSLRHLQWLLPLREARTPAFRWPLYMGAGAGPGAGAPRG